MLTAGRCRADTCRAAIVFVKTEASGGTKSMPLDVEPDAEHGNVVLGDNGRAVVYANAEAVPADVPANRRFLSHFATCPARAEHRRSR